MMQDEYVRCHALGHHWDPWGPPMASPLVKSGQFVREYVRCVRCTTERYGEINLDTGRMEGGYHYRYPKGYHDKTQPLRKPDFRRMLILSTIGKKKR